MKFYKKIILIVVLFSLQLSAQDKVYKKRKGFHIAVNPKSSYSKAIEYYNYPGKPYFEEIKKIISEEKYALKLEIETIEKKLFEGLILNEEAKKLKKQASEKRAKEIENRIAKTEVKLQKIIKSFLDKQIATTSVDSTEITITSRNFLGKKNTYKQKVPKSFCKTNTKLINFLNDRRTFEQGIFSYGINTLFDNDNFSNEHSISKSRFFEAGYTWNYRLFKDSWNYFLKYGGSLSFNTYELKNNQQYNSEGLIIPSNLDLKTSKLNNVQFVFPIHFEIDFSKPDMRDNIKVYDREQSFRIGFGGYAGYRLFSRQKLKYKDVNGFNIKNKSTGNYNLNNINYGVSGYFGYRSITLYTKQDLNSLFKNGNQKNISFGVRLEI